MNRKFLPKVVPLFIAFLLGAIGVTAAADTITLKDGRVIQGQFIRQGNDFLIQPDQGGSFTVPVSDLAGVVLGGAATTQQTATGDWQYTLYQISRETDAGKIINDIQAYMKQYPNSPDMKDAQATLAQYVEYQAQGYVKFAGQWMTPADQDKLKAQAQVQLNTAIKDYQNGALTQAQTDVQKSLTDDPTNTNAMIVEGVTEFRLNELQNALTEFNKALRLDPNNIAAVNDAAIASYQTNMQPHALLEYQMALNQAANNRMLLDNIASALINYQGDQTNPLYKNLQMSFNTADERMQTIMAQQGLYRFAASWIDAEQKSQLEAQEQEFEQKKLALQNSYDGVVQQLQAAVTGYNNAVSALPGLQSQLNNDQAAEYDELNDNPFADTSSYDQAIANDQTAISQAQTTISQFPGLQAKFQTQMSSMRSEAQVLMQSDPARGYNGAQLMMLPGDVNNVPPPVGVNMAQIAHQGQNPPAV